MKNKIIDFIISLFKDCKKDVNENTQNKNKDKCKECMK